MARTAPVPNIPAIPGMNPGIFVMGGGGGGGGGSGKKGKGAGGSQGADGEGGGDGADGADGDAGACGTGQNAAEGGCPGNHGGEGGQVAAGDPVDVVTGNVFTAPRRDVFLPGPLPLFILRSYNTGQRDRDVGLGMGWSHSLAWTMEERRRSVWVYRPDGTELEFEHLEVGEVALGPSGVLLQRLAEGYVFENTKGVRWFFVPSARSPRHYVLDRVADGWQNTVRLERDERGRWQGITDSAGRRLRVATDTDGRVTGFAVANARSHGQWVQLATYRYDELGHLVEAQDAEGFVWHYTYDDAHLLTRQTDPEGLTFRYRYDDQGRCIETWGEPRGDDSLIPELNEERHAKLADGTRARGVHHWRLSFFDDYTEAVNSIELERYVGNDFGCLTMAVQAGGSVHSRDHDEFGQTRQYTDPTGASQTWTRDLRGRVIAHIDPLGDATFIDRDADGHIREVLDPNGGVTALDRGDRTLSYRDAEGHRWHIRFDDRGLPVEAETPAGGRIRREYDDQGNLLFVEDADGRTERMSYDGLGRMIYRQAQGGPEIHYRYDARGLVVGRTVAGAVESMSYNGVGLLVAERDAAGAQTSYRYGGAHRLVEVVRPHGARYQLRYDREGQLRRIIDGDGRTHELERGPRGAVTRERTFDGRTHSYTYDLAGRLTERHSEGELVVSYEYDAAGRLKTRTYHANERTERFTHDANGHLIEAETPDGVFGYERNARGWIVAEVARFEGTELRVEIDYDPMGNIIARRTFADEGSDEVRWERSHEGRARKIVMDEHTVELHRDEAGHLAALQYPGGLTETRTRDVEGRINRQHVTGRGLDAVLEIERDPVGRTQRRHWKGEPSEELAYDAGGRLLQRIADGTPETFRYDAAGNVFPGGDPPELTAAYDAPKGRIEQWGQSRYEYDVHGRVRRRVTEAGVVQDFEWRDDGLLGVVRDDRGGTVTYRYDPLARRIQKRVERTVDGISSLVSDTRFLHDGGELVREIELRAREEGDPLVTDRAYLYEEGAGVPLLQRDRGEGARAGMTAWVVGDAGEPLRGFSLDGDVRPVRRSAWGAPEASDDCRLGFLGQYYDAEVDLWCNRFRYYDARAGRYISPDPKGLRGDVNFYAYADNAPRDAVDPDGLMPFSIIRDRDGKMVATGQNAAHHGGGVQQADAAAISSEARPSCAETSALHALVGDLDAGDRRAEIQRLFNEEGYTIETWDGNEGDYKNENPNSVPMYPCQYCARMFSDLGIKGQVRGPQRKKGKDKVKTGRYPSSTHSPYERHVRTTWDGKTIHE